MFSFSTRIIRHCIFKSLAPRLQFKCTTFIASIHTEHRPKWRTKNVRIDQRVKNAIAKNEWKRTSRHFYLYTLNTFCTNYEEVKWVVDFAEENNISDGMLYAGAIKRLRKSNIFDAVHLYDNLEANHHPKNAHFYTSGFQILATYYTKTKDETVFDRIEKIYQNAVQDQNFKMDSRFLQAFFLLYSKSGRKEKIEKLILSILSKQKLPLDNYLINIVLYNTFDRNTYRTILNDFPTILSSSTFSIILSKLLKISNVENEKITDVTNYAIHSGVQWTGVRKENIDEAFKLIEFMYDQKNNDIKIDEIPTVTFIKACTMAAKEEIQKQGEKYFGNPEVIKNRKIVLQFELGVRRANFRRSLGISFLRTNKNGIAWNEDVGEPFRYMSLAEKAFRMMCIRNIRPTSSTIKLLMKAYIFLDQPSPIHSLYMTMRRFQIRPDYFLYKHIIRFLSTYPEFARGPQVIFDLYKELTSFNLGLDRELAIYIIKALLRDFTPSNIPILVKHKVMRVLRHLSSLSSNKRESLARDTYLFDLTSPFFDPNDLDYSYFFPHVDRPKKKEGEEI